MQRKLAAISPLALLTLAACGGGGSVTVGVGGGGGATSSRTFGGNASKGPLNNAFVFVDLDGDGELDANETEYSTWTDADGAYSIANVSDVSSNSVLRVLTRDLAAEAGIDVTGRNATTDGSTGQALSGVVLSAPVPTDTTDDAGRMVTPVTTMVASSDLTPAQVADVLGLPDGLDPLTFNPYASGVTAADALAAEKAAHQIMNVIGSLASAGVGGGVDASDSYGAAITALVEVIEETANVNGATIDLAEVDNLSDIVSKFKDALPDAAASIGTVENAIISAMATENVKVDNIASLDGFEDYDSGGSSLAANIEANVENQDAGDPVVTFSLEGETVTEILENLAPGVVVGEFSPIGDADIEGIALVESDVSALFVVEQNEAGIWQLKVADGAEFEAQTTSEISLRFQITNADGSINISELTFDVLDVAEFDGNVVKGPLENARVFIDVNDNGIKDEGDSDYVMTDADGTFSVDVYIPEGATPQIVAETGDFEIEDASGNLITVSSLDQSSGEYLSGTTLSAPEGAAVVTPMTTLVAEAGLDAADVASALGLPEGVDPLTFNPYSEDADAAEALLVEKTAHQLMNTITTLKVAGETAGLTSDAAFAKSLSSFAEVIADASEQETAINLAVSGGDEQDAFGLSSLTEAFSEALLSSEVSDFAEEISAADLDATRTELQGKLEAVKSSVVDAMSTVNSIVAQAESLDPAATADFFSIGNKLAAEVSTAVEEQNPNKITVDNPTIAKNYGSNKAPTDISLQAQSVDVEEINENLSAGSVIGVLSASDPNENDTVRFELIGNSADLFELKIDGDVGENEAKVVVKAGATIDHEAAEQISLTVRATDKLGKSKVETFTVQVKDVDEDPSATVSSATVSQGEQLNVDLGVTDPEESDVSTSLVGNSDLFDVVDGKLVTTREVEQADVDLGPQTLTIMLTDTVTGRDVEHTVSVDLVNVNDEPIMITTALDDAIEGGFFQQTLDIEDADGDQPKVTISSGPDWLTVNGLTLEGTVPNLADKVSDAIPVVLLIDDGEATVKANFSLHVENVNDAPYFTVSPIEAQVVEAPDAVGVVDAVDSDKLTGTLTFADWDPGTGADQLSLSIKGGVKTGSSFRKAGEYGFLSLDAQTGEYVYTPDEAAIEPLFNELVTDTFEFVVSDGDLTDTLTMEVVVRGANDSPRIASQDQQNLVELGNGQVGTVIGDIKVLDGSASAGFKLADSGENNNNDLFEVVDGQLVLSLPENETTTDITDTELYVELLATDLDADGNEVVSETSSFLTITKVNEDAAPTIQSISTDFDGQPLKIGSELNFTVVLSEQAVAGGQATFTLSNGASVTVTVGDTDSQSLTGTYTVESGDGDTTITDPLAVINVSSTIADGGGNPLQVNAFPDLDAVVVDGNAPTAKLTGTDTVPHTYASSTGRLVLQGESLGTIVADESRDVSDIVDWGKLTWRVDAGDSVTHVFSASDVASAVVNAEGSQIVVTLSNEGQEALHALEGFGGTGSTGGTEDGLSVAPGFLRDAAGNLSTASSTANTAVELDDTDAPEVGEISISGAFTSPDATDRVRGDTLIVGDTLTFSATISDLNDLQDNDDMNVKLTLSNGEIITLVRPEGALGGSKVFSTDYVIEDGAEDVENLTITAYSVQNIVDVSGNEATNSKSINQILPPKFSGMLSDGGISIDATAPTAQLLGTDVNPHTYSVSDGELILQGEGLNTLVRFADEDPDDATLDVKGLVDWTKISWDVDGLGSTVLDLSAELVQSAVVNKAGDELTVQLTDAARDDLISLDDFGGTTGSGGAQDNINVSAGLFVDEAGNASSAASTAASVVALEDTDSPEVSSLEVSGLFTSAQISGREAGATFIAGDTLEFAVTLNDANDLRDEEDMSITLTLSNSEVVTLSRPAGATGSDKTFSGSYVITEGDSDTDDLYIRSYTVENVVDVSGNVAGNTVSIDSIIPTLSGQISDTVSIDANAPNAAILGGDADPHTYDASSGVLVLRGEGLGSLGGVDAPRLDGDGAPVLDDDGVEIVDKDVTSILDWSALTWNVDGQSSATFAFSEARVASAIVDSSGDSMTITLTSDARDLLHALDDFGGLEATGGNADAIDVGGSFLRDAAGNLSSEISTASTIVSLEDEQAPTLTAVTFDAVASTYYGAGNVEDQVTAPADEITFTATFDDGSGTELASDAELVLTLNNGVAVALSRSEVEGEELTLVGSYTVQADNSEDTLNSDGSYFALDVSNIDASGVTDISGNKADTSNLLDAVNIADVFIDTNAPQLLDAVYVEGSQTVSFVFDETLSDDSIAGWIDGLDASDGISNAQAGTGVNTVITADVDPSALTNNGVFDFSEDPIQFDDLAGNVTEIDGFTLDIQ